MHYQNNSTNITDPLLITYCIMISINIIKLLKYITSKNKINPTNPNPNQTNPNILIIYDKPTESDFDTNTDVDKNELDKIFTNNFKLLDNMNTNRTLDQTKSYRSQYPSLHSYPSLPTMIENDEIEEINDYDKTYDSNKTEPAEPTEPTELIKSPSKKDNLRNGFIDKIF